jgi:hypothetical protein
VGFRSEAEVRRQTNPADSVENDPRMSGTHGNPTYLNYAVWESTVAIRAAFGHPEFRAKLATYPASSRFSSAIWPWRSDT